MKKITLSLIAAAMLLLFNGCDKADMITPGGNQVGTPGSMSRFSIVNNHLYVSDPTTLQVFELTNPSAPAKVNELKIGEDIETIFSHGSHLFFGSRTGMIIYDISNPSSPLFRSRYEHMRSCDPVVSDGKYAYVTLRSGTRCDGNVNQLEILDVTNPSNPKLLKTYPMVNPHGLAIEGNTLFLCDGKAGLKVYDVENPMNIKLIAQYGHIDAYDVIPSGSVLMLIGANGLYEYDYSDLRQIKPLGSIPVTK